MLFLFISVLPLTPVVRLIENWFLQYEKKRGTIIPKGKQIMLHTLFWRQNREFMTLAITATYTCYLDNQEQMTENTQECEN